MRPLLVLCTVLLSLAAPLQANDALAEARRLYNAGQYDAAERLAREAARVPASADAARVVLGRIQLERYRRSAAAADLSEARAALRAVDPRALDAQERLELLIGLAEALYLDDQFGAAAELFEVALDQPTPIGPAARDRALDWWATATDRQAQTRPAAERPKDYERLLARMLAEGTKDPGSTPAVYWTAAAARGAGDLDRAWHAAIAGWSRAPFARDRGAALRADLDRLVTQAIIPERAARLPQRDRAQAIAGMTNEWDAFKAKWSR
jgi:tetratricopeptide (TPR) repeat protein